MSVIKTTEQASYIVSGTGTLAGLAFNEWLALGGLVIMALTFAVNTYFRWKHYKLEERRGPDK